MVKPSAQIVAKLKKARRDVKKANRKSVSAGGQIFVKSVRGEVPRDTGLLAKSITKKLWTHKNGQGVSSIIGSDSNVTAPRPRSIKYPIYRPSKILHLVEFGFRASNGRWVAGSGFMRRGYDKGLPQAEKVYLTKLASELDKLYSR